MTEDGGAKVEAWIKTELHNFSHALVLDLSGGEGAQAWEEPVYRSMAGVCEIVRRMACAPAPTPAPTGNYVCDAVESPQEVTFDNRRVVKLAWDDYGGPFLDVSPKSEYPKPCGICDGVIQGKSDLDWHGYGNCRDIPEPIMKQMETPAPSESAGRELLVLAREFADQVSKKEVVGTVLWRFAMRVFDELEAALASRSVPPSQKEGVPGTVEEERKQ